MLEQQLIENIYVALEELTEEYTQLDSTQPFTEVINFNAANMCRLPMNVLRYINQIQRKIAYTPNVLYRLRDDFADKLRHLISLLHPDETKKEVHLSFGSTFIANTLVISISAFLGRKPIVLALEGEHEGAKSPFQNYTNLKIFESYEKLEEFVLNSDLIDGFLISTFRYRDGKKNPIEKIWELRNEKVPNAFIIADLAQNFSVNKISFKYFDIGFASTHKWLAGAMGQGVLWISSKWSENLDRYKLFGSSPINNKYGLIGGCDFLGLVETYFAIKIRLKASAGYNLAFPSLLMESNLRNYGNVNPENNAFIILDASKICDPYNLYIKVIQKGVDIKFLSEPEPLYRITVPYFLSKEIINRGIEKISQSLCYT